MLTVSIGGQIRKLSMGTGILIWTEGYKSNLIFIINNILKKKQMSERSDATSPWEQ